MDLLRDLQLGDLGSDELLCVVGPTGSGKTELAIRLCEQLGGEVINADSVQVYRHFDLGSGKPTAAERARAVHHLLDIADPREPMDAARYASLADQAVAEVRSRGRLPVVCGGSYLWVRALVMGLAKAPPSSPELRARIRQQAAQLGTAALHARLAEVDPPTAARLSPNDLVRVERALEVWELTGRRLSELHAEHRAQGPRYKARLLGIAWDKATLEGRLRARAEAWLAQGWIDEVRELVEMGFRETRPMQSVGYRQVLAHLDGVLVRDELTPQVVRATKIFARRQRTWLRDEPVYWVASSLL